MITSRRDGPPTDIPPEVSDLLAARQAIKVTIASWAGQQRAFEDLAAGVPDGPAETLPPLTAGDVPSSELLEAAARLQLTLERIANCQMEIAAIQNEKTQLSDRVMWTFGALAILAVLLLLVFFLNRL